MTSALKTPPATYEGDFYTWSAEQAELLRALPKTARDLPNALDIENLAEEVESLGRSSRRAVESFFFQIFIHLLKAAVVDDTALINGWRAEIVIFQVNATEEYLPSMRKDIDLKRIWERALKVVHVDVRVPLSDEALVRARRAGPPLDVPHLTAEDFLLDAAIDRTRAVLGEPLSGS